MTDPKVSSALSKSMYVDEDGDEVAQALFAGLNDAMVIEIDSDSLVLRTSPNRGPAEKGTVAAPLLLEEQQLKLNFDLEALQEQVDDLGAAHGALEAEVSTITTTVGTDIGTIQGSLSAEITARTNADNALDARLDVFEGNRPPIILTGADLTSLGTPTGLPANRTCLGFAIDTQKLYVWGTASWIALN